VAEGIAKEAPERLQLQPLDGLRVFVLILPGLLTRRVEGARSGLKKVTVKVSPSFYIG
jgi:hypothetical protein